MAKDCTLSTCLQRAPVPIRVVASPACRAAEPAGTTAMPSGCEAVGTSPASTHDRERGCAHVWLSLRLRGSARPGWASSWEEVPSQLRVL
jgi:hypothetical protein